MDTRKKILFVITKSNWGGAQRYVYDLATSLPRTEYEVAVATGGNGLLISKLKEHDITVFHVRSFQRDISITKEFLSFFELLEIYRTFSPDVVHLNSSKAGGLGALAARVAGIHTIIFTAHGWPFWEARNILQKTIIAALSFVTTALSTITVCISEHDARAFNKFPFLRRKIRIIRNGVAPYPLLDRTQARAKLFDDATIRAHEHDMWVLSVAELTPNKDVITALDAVHLHNRRSPQKIFYAVMGDGELAKKVTEHMRALGADTHVVLLGFVENGRSLYKAFDAFLLTSRKEGVPYVLLEAGIAEIPCVATGVGGIPEIIKDGKNGFIRPKKDAPALAEALLQLSKDPALRKSLAHEHRKYVLENYSHEAMLCQTRALYSPHGKASTK